MGKSTAGKYQVKIQRLRLEYSGNGSFDSDKELLMIDIVWKGQRNKTGLLLGQFPRLQRNSRGICTGKPRIMLPAGNVDGVSVFEWDDEFETICDFSADPGDNSLVPWNVCFSVLQRPTAESEKVTIIGKVLVNIAELAAQMESSPIERKLPVALQVPGTAIEASLSVSLSFVEVRVPSCDDSERLGPDSVESSDGWFRIARAFGIRRGRKKQRKSQPSSLESSDSAELGASSSETQFESVKRSSSGFWKRRRLSFRSARVKAEPLVESNTNDADGVDLQLNLDSTSTTDSNPPGSGERSADQDLPHHDNIFSNNWEVKELVSRDEQSKLRSNVFFASFDQRSKEADGESACAALVAVVAHWLLSNDFAVPARVEFDDLIREGSLEWRRLCENESYRERFLSGHFDLETILDAGIKPLSISADMSFTGFFNPERFKSLEGAMSFDDIWDGISMETRFVYIVSWNDHFFVLMAQGDSYYIVDSLGERLSEGCEKAFILRFDGSSLMEENSSEGGIICSGKDCCREFIKRFLASIPLKELEEEQKKGSDASFLSLHRKLQIEFHYTSVAPPSLSPSSSPSASVFE